MVGKAFAFHELLAEDVNNPDAFMENKRNLLVELMFEQEVEIPGPWG